MITCYDKIKLLFLYTDLTHYYSLTAGYQLNWILTYFLQDIEHKIPLNIPYSNQFTLPTMNIGNGDLITISWLVKGKGIPYPEIINKTKRKLIKNKIKGYINGSY